MEISTLFNIYFLSYQIYNLPLYLMKKERGIHLSLQMKKLECSELNSIS